MCPSFAALLCCLWPMVRQKTSEVDTSFGSKYLYANSWICCCCCPGTNYCFKTLPHGFHGSMAQFLWNNFRIAWSLSCSPICRPILSLHRVEQLPHPTWSMQPKCWSMLLHMLNRSTLRICQLVNTIPKKQKTSKTTTLRSHAAHGCTGTTIGLPGATWTE